MTIAETGNRIVDAQARRGKAQADAEQRRQSRASKRSGKGGKRGAKSRTSRGHTNSKARSGRSAGKSARGRGITGQIHKSRSGGSASINYAINKKDAKFISSNAGLTVKDCNAIFKLAAGSRKDIKKNVGHESFSLPKGQRLSDEKWAEVVDFIRKEKGIDDGFPFVCGLHQDTDHQHIHLVYSRVSYDGRVVDDRFSKVRMALIEDMIENKFNLKLIPKPPTPSAPVYSKNEAEEAQRTGIKPARFVMFESISKAIKDKPDVTTFVERLKAVGVTARPAIRNNKMSGFSFSYRGVELGASKIHNSLGWNSLQKGIKYVANEDDPKLARIAASLDPRAQAEQPKQIPANREIPVAREEVERSAVSFETPTPSAGSGFNEVKKKPSDTTRRAEVPADDARVDAGIINSGDGNVSDIPILKQKKTPAQMLEELKEKNKLKLNPALSEKDRLYYLKRMSYDQPQVEDSHDLNQFPTM